MPIRWTVYAALGVLLVSAFDYLTGTELRIYPLYFLPLSAAGWSGSIRSALLIAALCTAGWVVSNMLAGMSYSTTIVWIGNVLAQAVGFAVVGFLMASVSRALERERTLSRIDHLTGLLNVRAFQEQGRSVLAACRRRGRSVALAYVDVDDFKRVNDSVGHAGGDRVLELVGSALRGTVRADDVAARMGGDEFAILMSETDEAGARSFLERVRETLARELADSPHPITLSVGAVVFAAPPDDLDELLRRADALMYRGKAEGKNRFLIERA